MPSPRKTFYNRKQYWKRKLQALDRRTLALLNAEARGDLMVPLKNYFDIGYEIVAIGEMTEHLFNKAVDLELGDRLRDELRDGVNMLEMFSSRLKRTAEKKWGADLNTFPVYRAILSASGALPLIPAVRALEEK